MTLPIYKALAGGSLFAVIACGTSTGTMADEAAETVERAPANMPGQGDAGASLEDLDGPTGSCVDAYGDNGPAESSSFGAIPGASKAGKKVRRSVSLAANLEDYCRFFAHEPPNWNSAECKISATPRTGTDDIFFSTKICEDAELFTGWKLYRLDGLGNRHDVGGSLEHQFTASIAVSGSYTVVARCYQKDSSKAVKSDSLTFTRNDEKEMAFADRPPSRSPTKIGILRTASPAAASDEHQAAASDEHQIRVSYREKGDLAEVLFSIFPACDGDAPFTGWKLIGPETDTGSFDHRFAVKLRDLKSGEYTVSAGCYADGSPTPAFSASTTYFH